MSRPIIIVGQNGKMARMLRDVLTQQKRPFQTHSQDQPASFEGALGVIDFSLPEATPQLLGQALKFQVPFVCGTTGWTSVQAQQAIFAEAAKGIPIVWDSNFSSGIEILSQVIEVLARQNLSALEIVDLHHSQKRDAPSGTALKLKERAQTVNRDQSVQIDSIRFGEIAGEHKIIMSLKDEELEFSHRALSRRPFAEGAIRALDWAQGKPPGIYSMKDVLK